MNRIENVDGQIINPATEDTQSLIALELEQFQFTGGALKTTQQSSGANASIHRISVSGSTPILDANSSRVFVLIQNEGSTLYLKLGATASLVDYSVQLKPGDILSLDGYIGALSGIRYSNTNDIVVTEVS